MENNKSKDLWVYVLNIFVPIMLIMLISNFIVMTAWLDSENMSFLRCVEISADIFAMIVNFMIYLSCMKINIYEQFAKWFMVLVFLCFVYMFSDVIMQVVQYHPQLRDINVFVNTIFYILPFMMFKAFWIFLNKWLDTPKVLNAKKNLMVNIVCIIGTIIIIINIFTEKVFEIDSNGVYSRGEYYYLGLICPMILLIIAITYVIKDMKETKGKIMVLIYFVAPYITSFITMNNKDSSFLGPVVFLAIFMIYSNMFVHYENEYKSKKEKALEYESELIETRLNLAISQIKPHFISNSLLLIDGLYKTDIKTGESVMKKFVRYLQMNFSEITRKKPVSIMYDIEQAQIYCDIAKKRWKDMSFEFKIEADDFEIPGMTIQPLVENAVRHGLMPLEEGGCVWVRTFKEDGYYYVEIKDNGVGFDIYKENSNDERKHIGISNISERLKIMCNGRLEIESQLGKGTKVIIRIPSEE